MPAYSAVFDNLSYEFDAFSQKTYMGIVFS